MRGCNGQQKQLPSLKRARPRSAESAAAAFTDENKVTVEFERKRSSCYRAMRRTRKNRKRPECRLDGAVERFDHETLTSRNPHARVTASNAGR